MQGSRCRRDPAQAESFEQLLSRLIEFYADRIVPITSDVAEMWGRLNVLDPTPVVDGLMAATALVHGWTLVTQNITDVAATGARLLDPFVPPN